jgi:predicted DNA-binding transcriptional regulator AlpA
MLLTFPELCKFLKADEAMVLSLIEAGSVPPPVNIGNRFVRWVESDLDRWVQTGCPSSPPLTPEELTLIRQQAGCAEKVGGPDAK